MMELNVVGWGALLGAGVAVAAVLRLVGLSWSRAVPAGPLAVFGVVKVRDRARWRAQTVRHSVGASVEVVQEEVDELVRAGLTVHCEEVEWEQAACRAEGRHPLPRVVVYRQRDAKRVKPVLARLTRPAAGSPP